MKLPDKEKLEDLLEFIDYSLNKPLPEDLINDIANSPDLE